MKRRNLVLVVAGLVLFIALGLFVVNRRGDQAIEAKLDTVAYTDFVTRLPETGVVQRPRLQTLTALVSGNIASVAVKPGEQVVTGQPLVTLSNPQIVSSAAGARANYAAAVGRVSSARQSNTVLPAQNQSSVEQAQFNLEQAKFNLNAAITDQKNGAQSGLGYGGSTAESQRVAADANVANARTNLSEAQRIYDADKDLFANKAIAKDALSQQAARLAQAQVAADQARRQRADTYSQLTQNVSVLADRARANRDAVREAQAALTAAQLVASQNKAGDVQAASGDAQARLNDWRFAQDQVARLTITAPYRGIVETIATQSTDSLRPLQPGDNVTAGQAIVTIAADSGFIVRARVDEQDISQVHVGQSAHVSGEDLGDKTLRGQIIDVGEVAQKSDDPSNTSRQIITTIRLDAAPAYLRDGMNVDVDIVTLNRRHVIAIATDAIRRDGDKPYVYIVRPSDRHAVKMPVALGAANDTQTIVTRGLAPGEQMVDDKNPAIVDNVAIKPAVQSSPRPNPSGGAA